MSQWTSLTLIWSCSHWRRWLMSRTDITQVLFHNQMHHLLDQLVVLLHSQVPWISPQWLIHLLDVVLQLPHPLTYINNRLRCWEVDLTTKLELRKTSQERLHKKSHILFIIRARTLFLPSICQLRLPKDSLLITTTNLQLPLSKRAFQLAQGLTRTVLRPPSEWQLRTLPSRWWETDKPQGQTFIWHQGLLKWLHSNITNLWKTTLSGLP